MVTITRRETFTAAHRLFNPAWTDERNRAIFGKDAQLHGHTYTLEVSVRGPVVPDTGMVMDLRELRDAIRRTLIDKLDHADLNTTVDFLTGRMPSAENIIVACWRELAPAIAPHRLVRLRLWESENNSVEYDGTGEEWVE
ncbi:MAG: 6-carboxytetrahydropterin synthase [Chloroflexi bacterium]|nr:6-carboxytetrahydropterin synthase [Chloroflexota bacterium]